MNFLKTFKIKSEIIIINHRNIKNEKSNDFSEL